MRFAALSLAVMATIAGIPTAGKEVEADPIFSHMMTLEVDQLYKGNLNKGIFTNTLWAEQLSSEKNTYNFYSTHPQHALGLGSGCGGHGCNLKKGEQAGSFSIRLVRTLRRKRLYKVEMAAGDMKVLEGKLCIWSGEGKGTFSCSAQIELRSVDRGRNEPPPFYTFRFSGTP